MGGMKARLDYRSQAMAETMRAAVYERYGPARDVLRVAEIELHEDAQAVSAPAACANRIDAIGISRHYFDRRRLIQDPAAHTAEPIARLFQAR